MEASIASPTAVHIPMSHTEYHAHPAIGASGLETFRDSRRKFHGMHVVKSMVPRPTTPAMQLGTLVHLRLLEPEKFRTTVAEPFPTTAPDGKKWLRREGSDHAKWWQDEIDKRAGMIACDEQTLDRIESIVNAIRSNERAAKLLTQDGQCEYAIFWTDADTGIECKCLVDWYAPIAVDLKTTADPSPAQYARSLVSLGYHRKLAHYRNGIEHLRGESSHLVHIAAETAEPYRVANYRIGDMDRTGFSLGVTQRRRLLHELAECYASGDWRDPFEKYVMDLQIPTFAFTEDSYYG
jgi:hypothetical protein